MEYDSEKGGVQAKVDGDAIGGFIVEVHDGDRFRTYGPEAVETADEAAAAALKLWDAEFVEPAAEEGPAPPDFGGLQRQVGDLAAAIATLHERVGLAETTAATQGDAIQSLRDQIDAGAGRHDDLEGKVNAITEARSVAEQPVGAQDAGDKPEVGAGDPKPQPEPGAGA